MEQHQPNCCCCAGLVSEQGVLVKEEMAALSLLVSLGWGDEVSNSLGMVTDFLVLFFCSYWGLNGQGAIKIRTVCL